MTIALWLTPWILVWAYVALRVRLPRPLPNREGRLDDEPFVSIIVPARNEARNIEACLESLTALTYSGFEIIVVDDRSDDRTRELASAVEAGRANRVHVVEGAPLPPGWFGKPWACFQGAREARGRILLFTDADTVHAPSLLSRAVRGMAEDDADAVTLLGRQVMDSFWERVLQPQFFVLLVLRYPHARRPLPQRRWRHAIANGQYILIRREAYDGLGGHAAVAGEVVEDLRLAQELVRAGHTLSLREAEDGLATRMYQSLADVVEGWGKNLATAVKQSSPSWAQWLVPPLALVTGALLWIAPPAVLVTALTTAAFAGTPVVGSPLVVLATAATAMSVVFWMGVSARLGAPAAYGLLYPLGAVVAGYIYLLSWWRGPRVHWKGRVYGGTETESP